MSFESEALSGESVNIERAVIIGGGIGGIAAAAALKEHANEVLIIEKDVLHEAPTPRKGAPQDEQLHNLLSRAQIHLDELMPGFTDDLIAHGAGNASASTQTHVFELGTVMPERDLGLRLMSAWRPIIEHVGRTHIGQADNVVLQGLSRVTGIHLADGAVSGVLLEGDKEELIESDLVVDASGVATHADRWLLDLGRRIDIKTKTHDHI